MKIETWLEFVEILVVAILVALGWSDQLSFLTAGSSTYWLVCILTSLYLVILFLRFLAKVVKERASIS